MTKKQVERSTRRKSNNPPSPLGPNSPAGIKPNGADFFYLGFTIGMTYQVSDTTLRDPQIRRSVLAHAVLSYVFGVVIVAGSVNLISGLFH